MKNHVKYCIIGAGLSGLTTAYKLLQNGETDFVILEGRDRIGGRLLTLNDIDFGAAWLQNYHTNLLELINELGLKIFPQFTTGKSLLMHNVMAPIHYFESDPNAPSAYRIAGGSLALMEGLAKSLSDKIVLNTKVKGLSAINQNTTIVTNNGTFKAEKTIIALPPKIAAKLIYTPELPEHLLRVMETTPTWMSHAIKVGINYEKPFWRNNGLSGTLLGRMAPVTEIYDHSNYSNSTFSLMGFVNENLRNLSASQRKTKILAYLSKYFGSEVQDYSYYFEKDWFREEFTTENSAENHYLSPKYGDRVFNSFYLENKLLFSGTETAPQHGGYMEGAVISGVLSANKLLGKN